jgi:nucleotide-binding universal stress UspA family protein
MSAATRTGQVVFGDDRSAGADRAWLWLNSQQWSGWRLSVLTAERPPFGPPVAEERSEPHPAEGEPRRRAFTEADFGEVELLEAEADPRIALCGFRDAALLVVGPSQSGLGPTHLGSTTEWLLHGPPAPLLIARSGRPVRRVLIGTDGSEHARAAAEAFAALPWATATEATVVAVKDGSIDADDVARSLADELTARGVPSTWRTAAGGPYRVLLDEVVESDIDLVVVGTRGLTGLARLRLGSTASAVARHAPCSVLVAEAPAGT